MEKKCAIVIPIYKDNFSQEEKISLKRVKEILNDYPIFYVAPKGLKPHMYVEVIPDAEIVFFDPKFFDGFEGYNSLMISIEFYSAFLSYDKILICQTDVFIISNQLRKFLVLDYDYIGAPCAKHKPWEKRIYVGNGGFSLRDVNATIRAIEDGVKNNIIYGKNEDSFFSDFGEKYPEKYRVAPVHSALLFSFDQSLAELCYEMSGKKLPMGIHGWFNYDTSFSKKLLRDYIPEDYVWKRHPKYSECLRQLDIFLNCNERVYFYGAGDIGSIFYEYCKIKNINIDGFVVSDNQMIDYESEKKIQHLSECKDITKSAVVITILQRYRARGLYKEKLIELGVTEILEADETMIFAVEDFLLRKTENSLNHNDVQHNCRKGKK